MNDHELLIERAAAGDGQAFAELVAPHRGELLRFAGRMLREDGQAGEEVVQEAMLNAYRALEQGTRPERLRPWLFQIVRNGALNSRRRRGRRGRWRTGTATPSNGRLTTPLSRASGSSG
jgi:RNA polymerase sigma factor (sigma-70 family)